MHSKLQGTLLVITQQYLLLLFFCFSGFKRLISSLIPNDHCACAIVALRDDAFKILVIVRVILYMHSQTFICRIKGRSFWHRPGLKHALKLQPEVIMQSRSIMFLNNESEFFTGCFATSRFWRFFK